MVTSRDLSRRIGDARCAADDPADDVLQARNEAVETVRHSVEFHAGTQRQAPCQVGVAAGKRVDVGPEHGQALHEEPNAADDQGQQQQAHGNLHQAQLFERAVAVLRQQAGRHGRGDPPRAARNRLDEQRGRLAGIGERGFDGGCVFQLQRWQLLLNGGGEHRGACQVRHVLQHHVAIDAAAVADDFAVGFDQQDLALHLLFHVGDQAVEKAQRDVDRGHAVERVALVDRHCTVGARLRAGVVLVGLGPVAVAPRGVAPVGVPRLLPVIERCRRVPVRVDCQLARRVTRDEGAELVAPRLALTGQRPDAAAEHVHVAVLVDQPRLQALDGVAVHQRHGLRDAALLRLDLAKLFADAHRDGVHRVRDDLPFKPAQVGRRKPG